MSKTKKAALAIAVLLLLGVVWFASRPAPTDEAPAVARSPTDAKAETAHRPRTRVAQMSAEVAADESRSAAAPAQTAAPAPTPAARDLVVSVVDPKGGPVAGVRVHINVSGEFGARADVRSGDDGRATFHVVGDVVSASADREAADGHAWRQRGGEAHVPPDATEIQIVVERWEPIRGRVVDEDSEPLFAVTVLAVVGGRVVGHVQTDEGGGFTIAVPPDAKCDVAASSGSLGTSADSGTPELVAEVRDVVPGGDGLRLVARPVKTTKPVHIRTVTSDGRALADVHVSVKSPQRWSEIGSGRTDVDGRFTVADVPDRFVGVVVEWPEYGEVESWEAAGWIPPPWNWWTPSLVRPGNDEVTIVFQAGRPIRGHIELPEELTAVRSASVNVSENGETVSRTWTDLEHRFTVWVPVTARGPFRISTGLRTPDNRRRFEGAVEDVVPGAQDVVLKLTETKR